MKEPWDKFITVNNPVVLGKISSSYGIKGWVKIISYTDKEKNIINYQPWMIYLNHKWHKIKLTDWKYRQNNLIIKIQDSNNQDEAKKFTNTNIIVDSSVFPILDSGEYYWIDLIGCNVITKEGFNVGTVLELISTGSNDVLVVYSSITKNKNKWLIPFIHDKVIKNIDLLSKNIEITWNKKFFTEK
ncbi:MAG: ribosome maturation factor RimM [Candidatus Dasytiphilus stammeri]